MKHKEEEEDTIVETIHGVFFGILIFKLKVKELFLVDEVRLISSIVEARKIKFTSNTKNLLLEVSKS